MSGEVYNRGVFCDDAMVKYHYLPIISVMGKS